MKIFLPILTLIFCFSVVGQKKSLKRTSVPRDSVLSDVLRSLAKPEICGSSDNGHQTTFSGVVVKRELNRRATEVTGFVIVNTKHRRTHVSLYADHIDGLADSASRDLKNFLIVGRKNQSVGFSLRSYLLRFRNCAVLISKVTDHLASKIKLFTKND